MNFKPGADRKQIFVDIRLESHRRGFTLYQEGPIQSAIHVLSSPKAQREQVANSPPLTARPMPGKDGR